MANPIDKDRLTVEEIARLIYLRNELRDLVTMWQKSGWNKTMAQRFKALLPTFENEPTPSKRFKAIAQHDQPLTDDQLQMLVQGGLLAQVHKAGGKLYVLAKDILAANEALGTISLAISDDKSTIMFVGMK